MDAVKMEIEKMGGKISVSSKINDGTIFTIILPILG
jgi:chemotaxis protein histidine kinase CheA